MIEQDGSAAYGDPDFDHEGSNRSTNTHFDGVLRARMVRSRLHQGGLDLGGRTWLFGTAALVPPDPISAREPPTQSDGEARGSTAVPVGHGGGVVVPPEYAYSAILPWGEPIAGACPGHLDGGLNSGADQELQTGMHDNGMDVLRTQRTPPFTPVAHMGEDAQNEYIYRFVSRDRYAPRRAGGAMLDHGTLYVARFHEDGGGEWLPLDIDDPGFAAAAAAAGMRFDDQADVLVNARLAADVAGATPMDRAEWGAVDPRSGEIYFTLTNNSLSGSGAVDSPNPRGPNPYGRIIRLLERADRGDPLRFEWDVFVLSGSSWPGRMLEPRSPTVVVTRRDGGVVGP